MKYFSKYKIQSEYVTVGDSVFSIVSEDKKQHHITSMTSKVVIYNS